MKDIFFVFLLCVIVAIILLSMGYTKDTCLIVAMIVVSSMLPNKFSS